MAWLRGSTVLFFLMVAQGSVGSVLGDYRAAVIALNPTHYYALDETEQPPSWAADSIETGSIDGYYLGNFSVAQTGVSGVDWAGFPDDNRAFHPNAEAVVDLGAQAAFVSDVVSLSLWVKIPSTAILEDDRLFSNNASTDCFQVAMTNVSNNQGIKIAVGAYNPANPSLTQFLSGSQFDFDDEQWHFLTVVRNGDNPDNLALFVDGTDYSEQLIDATVGLGNKSNGHAWIAGRASDSGCFGGLIDEVGFWPGVALTLENHQTLYAASQQSATLPPGDADGDGFVNHVDAGILASHWLQAVSDKAKDGDFNGDGWVDDLDASIMAANWTGSSENHAVPEPSTIVLLLAALLGLPTMVCRRSSRY